MNTRTKKFVHHTLSRAQKHSLFLQDSTNGFRSFLTFRRLLSGLTSQLHNWERCVEKRFPAIQDGMITPCMTSTA